MSRSVRDDYIWKGRPGDGPDPASIDSRFSAAHYQDGRDLKQHCSVWKCFEPCVHGSEFCKEHWPVRHQIV